MQKEYTFSVEEIKRIEFSDYDEQEFSIARLGYISTKPNSHGIVISEDCLRESAPSALGKWVVAKMFMGDATTHDSDEHIVGMIPKEQEKTLSGSSLRAQQVKDLKLTVLWH